MNKDLITSIYITVSTFVFCSCNKEQLTESVTSNESVNEQRISANPSYRGLYVDNFHAILGDTAQENNLLRWCKKYKIKVISLYDLNIVFLHPANNNEKVAAFIKKAKTNYLIRQVTAIRGSGTGFSETLSRYNDTRSDTTERFNVFNLENEWWNNGTACDFTCYTSDLTTMTSLARAASPPLLAEEYIGWFQNPTGQEQLQADTLVAYSDRILVHDYRTAPDFGYMQSRLSYLGKAAKAQHKIINIIIIFSAEPSFSGNYFDVNGQNHSFDDAYFEIVAQHNAATFTGKQNIKIIGYQLFDYSYAKAVRP